VIETPDLESTQDIGGWPMSIEASIAAAINNESLSDQDQLVLTRGELNRIVASAFRDIMVEIDVLREDVAREHAQDRQRIAAWSGGNPGSCGRTGARYFAHFWRQMGAR